MERKENGAQHELILHLLKGWTEGSGEKRKCFCTSCEGELEPILVKTARRHYSQRGVCESAHRAWDHVVDHQFPLPVDEEDPGYDSVGSETDSQRGDSEREGELSANEDEEFSGSDSDLYSAEGSESDSENEGKQEEGLGGASHLDRVVCELCFMMLDLKMQFLTPVVVIDAMLAIQVRTWENAGLPHMASLLPQKWSDIKGVLGVGDGLKGVERIHCCRECDHLFWRSDGEDVLDRRDHIELQKKRQVVMTVF
jgi:hypothetical protein